MTDMDKKTKRVVRVVLAAVLGLMVMVSGCATLNKEECLNADWYSIGFEDGSRGYAASHIGRHRKACAEHGVRPDAGAYQAGHAQGLQTYCTPRQGYQLGLRNKSYNPVCHGPLRDGFQDGYREGQKIYAMNQRVADRERDVTELREEMDKLTREIEDMKAELVSDKTSRKKRKKLLNEIRMAETSRDNLSSDVHRAERRLNAAKRMRKHALSICPYE